MLCFVSTNQQALSFQGFQKPYAQGFRLATSGRQVWVRKNLLLCCGLEKHFSLLILETIFLFQMLQQHFRASSAGQNHLQSPSFLPMFILEMLLFQTSCVMQPLTPAAIMPLGPCGNGNVSPTHVFLKGLYTCVLGAIPCQGIFLICQDTHFTAELSSVEQ